MLNGILRTPLYAAFFCAVILSACSGGPPLQKAAPDPCSSPTTPISKIQGQGQQSQLIDQQHVIKGVVTLVEAGRGLYIEEADSDANDQTSNAMFVLASEIPENIETGSLIRVSGVVSELGDKWNPVTAITGAVAITWCSANQELPRQDVKLPLDDAEREALESMRIRVDMPLVATDVYALGRGNITLSGNGLQFVSTEVKSPGLEAGQYSSDNRQFLLPVRLPENLDIPELITSGATFSQITGIMAHDDRGLRVSLENTFSDSSTISTIAPMPPPVTPNGAIRIVGMNLHNYFNGDGKGLGFPTERGAKTPEAFQQQRDRIGAAIKVLNPDLLAVMELENDGFDAHSAAQDFINLANQSTTESWAFALPASDDTNVKQIGDDKITVGIFYRNDRLKAVGPALTLTGNEFRYSRQPLAQLFEDTASGEKTLVVVNHLKSKGSCPDSGEDARQNDGQGCWNPMRTTSAKIMSAWVNTIAKSAGTDNILILGDMNAYRNEEPIEAIRQAGFTELMDDSQDETYSFVYFGQHGTLDYAFSSKALENKVQQAFIWNANVPYPARIQLPEPWLGFSDHDPVVVDIKLAPVNNL